MVTQALHDVLRTFIQSVSASLPFTHAWTPAKKRSIILFFLFWLWCCMSFDLWIIITLLISSNTFCISEVVEICVSFILASTGYTRGDDNNVSFVLDHHASSQKHQSLGRHVAPYRHIILIRMQDWRRSSKYQLCSLWFDPIGTQTHDLPQSRWEQ